VTPRLFKSTAFFVTFDEGGGYWDSGFFQPIDFFGDGPRIPFIAVSKYSRGGKIVHSYGDHASVVKFIERNWHLQPLTQRTTTTRRRRGAAQGEHSRLALAPSECDDRGCSARETPLACACGESATGRGPHDIPARILAVVLVAADVGHDGGRGAPR
jgi:Phosphoesterase family